ncbi:c-type cytochrome [Sphingobium algorifonticola]|nr:cytochrome c [Sphingobium algorifonticola]
MTMMRKSAVAAGGAALLAALAMHAPAQADASAAMPEGPARGIVEKTCTGCHVASQVTAQRKTSDQWAQTVDQMIGYGAQVSDEDYAKIVDYLATNFGSEGQAGSPTS